MNEHIKALEDEYNTTLSERKKVEAQLIHTQKEIEQMAQSFEQHLILLQELQQKENSLQYSLLEARKNYFKTLMSSQSIKNILNHSVPLLSKIKKSVSEKTDKIKDYLNGAENEQFWIDKQYEEYRQSCLNNNEHIKTKTEFKDIVLVMKKADDEKNANFFRKALKKTSKKLDKLTATPKIKIESSITKEKALLDWIHAKHVTIAKKKSSLNDLYEDYLLYHISLHGNQQLDCIRYELSDFKQALIQYFGTLSYNEKSQQINLLFSL